MAIGSVEVDVVPASRTFVSKLRADILPGAGRVGEEWGRDFGTAAGLEARARIDGALRGLKNPKVDVDTGAADAKLAALNTELDNTGRHSDGATKKIGLLKLAVVGLAPAAVPLGAVLAAGFGAGAAGAGVLLLGIKGIQAQMKAGTVLGRQYTSTFAGLTTVGNQLEAVSAAGLFPGIQKSVGYIKADVVALSADTSVWSQYLGDAAAHVTHGLVGGLNQAAPLITFFLGQLDKGAAALDRYGNGGGFAKFLAYAQQQAPGVEHDLAQIATLVGHLLEASAGQGTGVLGTLGLLARVLNQIPEDKLKELVPVIADIYLGFKAWTFISGVVNGANAALGIFATRATAAATAQTTLNAAQKGGVASGALDDAFGGGALFRLPGKDVAGAAGADIGALGGGSAAGAAGLTGAAALAVPAAVAGGIVYAIKTGLNLALGHGLSSFNPVANQSGDYFGSRAVNKVKTAYDSANLTSSAQAGNQSQYLSQLAQSTPAAKAAADAQAALAAATLNTANSLGLTVTQYKAAGSAAAQQAAQVKTAAQAMQLENDAAGLLSASLGKLGTNGATVAEGQTALGQANLALGSAFKSNGKSISDATTKGLANRAALDSQRDAALTLAEAVGTQTGSTIKAVASLNSSKQAALNAAAAHGDLTAQVRAYIDNLYKIPAEKLTKIDLKIEAAAALKTLQRLALQLDALHSKTINVNVHAPAAVGVYGGQALAQRAGGGLIPGYAPGVDSVPIMASPGEGVLTPEAVRAIGGAAGLYALNSATTNRPIPKSNYRFAGGGIVPDGKKYKYNGIIYSTLTSAENARTRADAAEAKKSAAASAKVSAQLAQTLAGYRSTGVSAGNASFADRGLSQVVSSPSNFAQAVAALAGFLKAQGKSSVSIVAGLEKDNKNLAIEVKARAKLVTELATANTNLTTARSNRSGEYNSVRATIVGSGSLTSTGFADTFGIKSFLANKVKVARQFYADEKTALKHGVDPSLVQQMVDAGPDAAAVTLHTLATANKADVSSIDSLERSLNATGGAQAKFTAHQFFDSGVNAAQGIVNGLTSQTKAATDAVAKLADAMVKTFRKELGIKSPSTVMHELGVYTGQGYTNGMNSHLDTVRKTATAYARASLPPGSLGATGSAGGNTLVKVYLGDKEITDIVRTEVSSGMDEVHYALLAGAGN